MLLRAAMTFGWSAPASSQVPGSLHPGTKHGYELIAAGLLLVSGTY